MVSIITVSLAAMTALATATTAEAQAAKASPLVAIENELPAELFVDAPWHFVDASGQTVVLVGLPPGQHKVLLELADPTHRVITSKVVTFTVPNTATKTGSH